MAKRYQICVQHVTLFSIHHASYCANVFNMAARKDKLKRCLAVLRVLDTENENENEGCKRGKTRGWILRRQESGFFNNIVR